MQEFYYRLALGDRTNIARAFRGVPLISDPRFGEVHDWPGFESYVSSSAAWLGQHKAHFSAHETTQNPSRTVLEGRLTLTDQDPPALILVAMAAVHFAGGMKNLRIYHSLESTGLSPRPRVPLTPNPSIILPDAPAQFVNSLGLARADEIRKTFSQDGRLTAPSIDGLDNFVQWLDGAEPQVWQLCTLTSAGHRLAVEYNLTQPEDISPSPGGCAVFELAPTGEIQRLRIYPAHAG